MDKIKGFSLAEILLSLLLITTASLALMRQHWQLNQQVNHILIQSHHKIENDNRKELKHAGLPAKEIKTASLQACYHE